jgi:hypothetical protein
VLGAAVVCGLWASRQPAKEVAVISPPPQQVVKKAVETPPPAPVQTAVAPRDEPPPQEPMVKPVANPQKTVPVQRQNQPSKPPKEPLHDPDARDALALVGVDSDAEGYWLDAIFDTSLPDKERDDLMEDLNEVGFADPSNVTPDDLPLIASRLQIINEVLPYADPFMTGHLLEAEKDLANMYAHAAH